MCQLWYKLVILRIKHHEQSLLCHMPSCLACCRIWAFPKSYKLTKETRWNILQTLQILTLNKCPPNSWAVPYIFWSTIYCHICQWVIVKGKSWSMRVLLHSPTSHQIFPKTGWYTDRIFPLSNCFGRKGNFLKFNFKPLRFLQKVSDLIIMEPIGAVGAVQVF